MSVNVAFIGLGVMGFPMAGHLQRAGYSVTVFNRTTRVAEQWVAQYGGQRADTPRQAAEEAEVVFVCVGNDDDVRAVVFGESGALTGLQAGETLVDHTTASAALAREIADTAAQGGRRFLDAPVSGGQQGAEAGQLAIMVGADPNHFDHVLPLFNVYGKAVNLIGPVGSGQLCKMVNQICVAGVLEGLAEGLNFAAHAGLDIDKVVGAIGNGAAQSWQMNNRYQTMVAGEYNHGFAVDWMRKDLAIALAEASRNGAQLPGTALVDQFYAEVQAMGGGRWDTSSLLARLQALNTPTTRD